MIGIVPTRRACGYIDRRDAVVEKGVVRHATKAASRFGRSVRDVVSGVSRYSLSEGDCLELMPRVPPGTVDLILADLPYGMTDCDWDKVLPFPVLWWNYRRMLKPRGAVVLTASQPFATDLGASRRDWLKVEWIWDKVNRSTGFAMARKRPMKIHENVLVFYRRQPTYNPQMTKGKPYVTKRKAGKKAWEGMRGALGEHVTVNEGTRYPTSILRIPAAGHGEPRGLHPTRKPVRLMEYFVRTYSNAGDLVLDNCMGSGSTGEACMRSGRRFIGMELDHGHFMTARARIRREAARARRRTA